MPMNIAPLNTPVNSTDKFSAAYYSRMTRREVLIDLIKEKFGGNQAEFARAIKRSPSQVHQWVSGHRNLGEAGARHIEITLGLPQGYFDFPDRRKGSTSGQGPMRATEGEASAELPAVRVSGQGDMSESAIKQAEAILPMATERSTKSLERIIQLAKAGRLTEEDMEELARIAERFAQ